MTHQQLSTISPSRPLDVIMADDEPSDRLLFSLAAQDAAVDINFTFVDDGEELLELLA